MNILEVPKMEGKIHEHTRTYQKYQKWKVKQIKPHSFGGWRVSKVEQMKDRGLRHRPSGSKE